MPIEIARDGFEAWRHGDFDVIERMLDPSIEWRWFEPGDWDCHGRGDVMRTLRERYEQGFARGASEFHEAGRDSVIVVAHPSEVGGSEWPDETATVLTFQGDRVVSMQDYRTEADARAATE
jgi:ketosteroid isomerase-like protein